MALCNVQMHLESAYRKFFTEPKTGFPRFHSKHHGTASYTTNVINGNIRLVSGRLKLPKMAPLKIILHRDVPTKARLKSVTVTREASGKYYASLLYEQENCENQTVLPVRADKVLGIDFAMAGLAVFSDGTKAEYPMYYRKGEQRLAREQRKLSRCKRAAGTMRSRSAGSLYVMKKYGISGRIFRTSSSIGSPSATMRSA